MPVLLQASMSSVPAGTVSFLPSTVSVTSATIFLDQLKSTALHTSAGSATFPNGHGLPSRWSSNSLRYFCTYEMIGIAAASPSGQNVRPSMFSARYFKLSMSLATPPPAWKRVSVFFIQSVPSRQGTHDAHGVVEHDDAPRAEHRAGLHHRVEIHGDVDLMRRKNLNRRSAGHDTFQRLAIHHPAGNLIDHLLEVVTHGQFVNAGAFELAAHAEESRAAILGSPQVGEPLAAAQNDVWHTGE